MELRHLRYFVVVAELSNVSRAAVRLRVAQPALSRQVRDLEEEVGVPLLERNSRGVRLTPAGVAFAAEAREILERVDGAVKAARAVARGQHGEIHLAYAPSPTAELLPRALHAFQNAAPGVRVVLHDCSSEEMVRGLRDGTLQVALMVRPCERDLHDLAFEQLQSYATCVAVGPGHPLARERVISVDRLRAEKLVVYSRVDYGDYHAMLDRIFAGSGGTPSIAQECDSATSLIAAVEAGRGVAIVPSVLRCLAGTRLKLRPLTPEPAVLDVGFAYVPALATPGSRRWVETLRSLAPGSAGRGG